MGQISGDVDREGLRHGASAGTRGGDGGAVCVAGGAGGLHTVGLGLVRVLLGGVNVSVRVLILLIKRKPGYFEYIVSN